MKTARPLRHFVLLLDDQPDETVNNGIVVVTRGAPHMDYTVVRVGTEENVDYGQGDRVVVSDPNIGRRVRLDGVVYRLVRTTDIIAKMED